MFLPVVGLLTLLALAFCWPLWRSMSASSVADSDPAQPQAGATAESVAVQNALLYQSFEAELLEDRTIDAQQRSALLADKARQLLDDSRIDSSTAAPEGQVPAVQLRNSGLGWGIKILAAAVIVAGSAVTYWNLGTPGADRLKAAREILTLPTLAEVKGDASNPSIERLRSLTGGLRGQVKRSADDAGSWYLLGIGELKLQSYTAAADAFEAAHALVGPDANLDLYWLQARLLADDGKLSDATREIAKRVLGTQPNQPMVLNMLALAAYRSNDFATAVGYLNSALSNNLTEGQRELLTSGFNQARQSLGVAGPTVDVALSLEGEPPENAVLFVIARPVGGGMPYAVVRRPANGVPSQVRLDDAVSMNPANPLSAASDVEIVARLSLTGRPQAGPGDWQWQSGPVRLAPQARSERQSGDALGEGAGGAPQPILLQAQLATPAS